MHLQGLLGAERFAQARPARGSNINILKNFCRCMAWVGASAGQAMDTSAGDDLCVAAANKIETSVADRLCPWVQWIKIFLPFIHSNIGVKTDMNSPSDGFSFTSSGKARARAGATSPARVGPG